jgi:hypothetical protein
MYLNACAVLVRLTGVGCCPSCAFDEEDGYDLIEIESPSCITRSDVCCVHDTEPVERDQRRVWWAILLRASRAQRVTA